MRNIRTTTAKNTNTKSPEIDVKSEAVDVDPPLQFTADQRVMTGGGISRCYHIKTATT